MRCSPIVCICFMFTGWPVTAAEPAKTGTIQGNVRFTGTVPKPQMIRTTDGSTIEHSDLVVDQKTKGLRYVIAVLEDAPEQPKVKDAKPVVVDQVSWVFQPRVVAVQCGQAVRFDNSDTVNHSVMAISTVKENQLNTVAAPGSPVIHTFEPQKTPVLIGCSLHSWMRAWVYISRHPWFAVSGAEGKFKIDQIPPGKYTLLLHHPDTNLRERKAVEVRSDHTLEVTVEWSKVGK